MTEIGTGPAPVTPEEFAELVNGEWRKSVEGIVEAGRWLVRAKDELEHGEFGQMVDMLVFGDRTARRLMAVGRDERLRTHVSVLPPSWGTLYELSRLDDKEWAAVEPHLTPTLERKDIKGLLPKGPDPDPAPEGESNGVPWGDEDKWCWKLKNLYKQAPKRSQNAFRKWFDQQVVIRALSPNPPTKRRLARLSLDDFEHALATVTQVVESAYAELHVPPLTAHMRDEKVRDLDGALQHLRVTRDRVAAADLVDDEAS